MDDIASLLSSITPEEMERLKGIASSIAPSIMPETPGSDAQLPTDLMSIMQNLNSTDDKTELIRALKPFLSEEKQKRADEAMRLLKVMRILPLIGKLNINDLPV